MPMLFAVVLFGSNPLPDLSFPTTLVLSSLCVAAASWKGGGIWFCNTGFNIGKFSLGPRARWRKKKRVKGEPAKRGVLAQQKCCPGLRTGTTAGRLDGVAEFDGCRIPA
jgi:hypothetical protein